MMRNSLLQNISIILVRPRTPANIGAVARCMMNMGLSRMVLVRPLKENSDEAFKLAAGADEILKHAEFFSTLEEAVAGSHLVIGTSRHRGRLRKNINTPREMAAKVVPLLARNSVAVVFGDEVNGLDNDEIALCNEIVSIPSSNAFPSLNLSHAVLVVAYELFLAAGAKKHEDSNVELARAGELEGFHRHLEKTLQDIGFLDQDHPERMMLALRQLFGRARLDERDLRILRGILSRIERLVKGGRK